MKTIVAALLELFNYEQVTNRWNIMKNSVGRGNEGYCRWSGAALMGKIEI